MYTLHSVVSKNIVNVNLFNTFHNFAEKWDVNTAFYGSKAGGGEEKEEQGWTVWLFMGAQNKKVEDTSDGRKEIWNLLSIMIQIYLEK